MTASGDTPDPSPPTPVVPATRPRLMRRAASTWVFAAGTILEIVVESSAALKNAFPGSFWLPKALTIAGILWLALQRTTDIGHTEPVNYSDRGESNHGN